MKLSASDICKIIKTLSETNALEFNLGELHITFMGQKAPSDLTDVSESPNNSLRSVPLEPVTSDNDIEDDLTMQLLSNPSAYEDMVEVE